MDLEQLKNALRMALQRDIKRPVFPQQQNSQGIAGGMGGQAMNQRVLEAMRLQQMQAHQAEAQNMQQSQQMQDPQVGAMGQMQSLQDALRRQAPISDMDMQRLQQLKALGEAQQKQQAPISDMDMQRLRPATEVDRQQIRQMMQGATHGLMPERYQPPRYPLGMSYPVQR